MIRLGELMIIDTRLAVTLRKIRLQPRHLFVRQPI